MDLYQRAVLNKLNSLGGGEKYIIVSADEFGDCLPDGKRAAETLNELAGDGFIDVKYSRGNMFCLAVTKEPDEAQSVSRKTFKDRIFDPVLLSAFAGGALGSLIVAVIFALV